LLRLHCCISSLPVPPRCRPERFQDEKEKFDVVITCEVRITFPIFHLDLLANFCLNRPHAAGKHQGRLFMPRVTTVVLMRQFDVLEHVPLALSCVRSGRKARPPNLSGFISHNAKLRGVHVLEVCRFRSFQKVHKTDHQLFSLKVPVAPVWYAQGSALRGCAMQAAYNACCIVL
jgi:hypothetical protein